MFELTARICYFALNTGLDPEEYETLCRAARLPARREGWGLLFCEDEDGNHVTLVTEDLQYQFALADSWGSQTGPADFAVEFPDDKYRVKRGGWPEDWPAVPKI
jgi:hypothetical protein